MVLKHQHHGISDLSGLAVATHVCDAESCVIHLQCMPVRRDISDDISQAGLFQHISLMFVTLQLIPLVDLADQMSFWRSNFDILGDV